MRKTYKFVLMLFAIVYALNVSAQVSLEINVKNANNEQLVGSEISVTAGDSTISFAIMSNPNYTMKLPSAGSYEISVAHLGYAPFSLNKYFSKDSTLSVVLEPCAVDLEGVVVQGKGPRKITATGEVFHLSQKAKKSGDPFRALSEIPLLNVDIINQKVTTNAGDPLLVLVDGHLQNSGISPIDPKFIENVEISEVVSARYLKMGVKKIINIRLKKNRPLYAYTDIRTRHDIPLREGFGGANFEFGKRKFAVSGSVFYNYLHKDKSDFEREEQSPSVSRILKGEKIGGKHAWESSVMAKWVPNNADYFSFAIKTLAQNSSISRNLEGQYIKNQSFQLNSDFQNRDKTDGVLGGIYHEHTFKNESVLTTFFQYNYCISKINETLNENFNNTHQETNYGEKTARNQYTLSVDFDTQEKSFGDINIGNELEYTLDKNKDVLAIPPVSVNVTRWSNYTYLGYTNSWKKLFYMASIGLEHLGVKVLEHTHTCWRPRISTSFSLQLPRRQSLRLAYNLDNSLPSSDMLFTFDNTLNLMLHLEGNPYLIPEQKHSLSLYYNKDFKNVRATIYALHKQEVNIIEPYIYSNGQIQIQSYKNNGTYKESRIGASARYGGKDLTLFLAASHEWKNFNGQGVKTSVGINGYVRWDFGNFFIYSRLGWKNRDYTPISTIKYENPIEAHIQIAWQATKQVYVSVGLPYFWGKKSQITTIDQSVYKSWQRDCFRSMSLRPWILISWTLRKNAKEAIPNKMPDL